MEKYNISYNHGLIVWDCDPQTVHFPYIVLDGEVIGEAVVVVYDITNPSSFQEAVGHVQHYKKLWTLSKSQVVGLVGSKADLLMHRKIKYEVLSCYDIKLYSCLFSMEMITLLLFIDPKNCIFSSLV